MNFPVLAEWGLSFSGLLTIVLLQLYVHREPDPTRTG
jgi:hypothetical protein